MSLLREFMTTTSTPEMMYMPKRWKLIGRTRFGGNSVCFSIQYFTHIRDANACARTVEDAGRTYGGVPDGIYTDDDGVRWFAVTF
jgi:hypothetical protein